MFIKRIFGLFTKNGNLQADLAGSGGLSRYLRIVEMPEYLARNIKTVSDKKVRKALTGCASLFSGEKFGMAAARSKNNMSLLDDLVLKMQMCDDPNVKAQVESLILATKNQPEEKASFFLSKAEELLDSVNVAGGKYSNIFNSDVRKTANLMKQHNKIFAEPFRKYAQLSGIKSYIENNQKDKEMAKYLWEKYFLSTLDDKTAQTLRKFDNDYGVKIFFDCEVSEAKLYWLNEEFAMQKRVSGGTAEFPMIYDITEYEPRFIGSRTDAYYCRGKNKIAVNGAEQIERTTRHEMLHANDKSVDTGSVMKFTAEEKAELSNAGLAKDDISYSETDIREARAVFAQANMKKISDGFKRKMISNGVPEYFTRMEQISCRAYLNNKLSQVENHEKILADLEAMLGGKISVSVADALLRSDKDVIEMIPDILKNCDKKVLSEYSFLTALYTTDLRKLCNLV